MDTFSFNGEIRTEIRKKLDEHIKQILEKPAISVEEHHLLEWVDSRYAEMDKKLERSDGVQDTSWLFILLFIILYGFGGDKNGL